MASKKFSLEERIEQLAAFEAENGHTFVSYGYKKDGLGDWVNNTRAARRKNKLKAEDIAKLDQAGFVWNAKGADKTKVIEWGKNFRWVNQFYKDQGHCNVPGKIGGKPIKYADWCNEQRNLFLDGKLEQEKIDKLTKIKFNFYGNSEVSDEDDDEGPPAKRQRMEELEATVEFLRKQIDSLKTLNATLQAEIDALKQRK